MNEPARVALRVIQPTAYASAVTDANRDGASLSACAAIAQLRSLLGDGIYPRRDEIDKLDLRHRPHSRHRRTDRGTDDRAFGKRRVDDSLITELLKKAFRSLEGAAHLGNVFADHKDIWIAFHLFVKRRIDGVDVRHYRHDAPL